MSFSYYQEPSIDGVTPGKTFEKYTVAADGTTKIGVNEIDVTLAGATTGLVGGLAAKVDTAVNKMLKGPQTTASATTDTSTNKTQEGNLEFYSKTGIEVSTASSILEVGKSAASIVINSVKEGAKKMGG